jgi:hypothetical protein
MGLMHHLAEVEWVWVVKMILVVEEINFERAMELLFLS